MNSSCRVGRGVINLKIFVSFALLHVITIIIIIIIYYYYITITITIMIIIIIMCIQYTIYNHLHV